MKYILIFLLLIQQTSCGPIAYATCQAACAAVAAAAAGGGAWMAMPAVMSAYSICQSACTGALIAPIP
jgi:hypothetical protein